MKTRSSLRRIELTRSSLIVFFFFFFFFFFFDFHVSLLIPRLTDWNQQSERRGNPVIVTSPRALPYLDFFVRTYPVIWRRKELTDIETFCYQILDRPYNDKGHMSRHRKVGFNVRSLRDVWFIGGHATLSKSKSKKVDFMHDENDIRSISSSRHVKDIVILNCHCSVVRNLHIRVSHPENSIDQRDALRQDTGSIRRFDDISCIMQKVRIDASLALSSCEKSSFLTHKKFENRSLTSFDIL